MQYRIFLIFGALIVGGVAAYVVTSSQMKAMPKQTSAVHPSEDPKNAFILPAKIHPVTKKMDADTMAMSAKKATDFNQPDENGKMHSLAELSKDKPLLLYFIDKECPCCITAMPVVERVRQAYQDELNVYGVIDAGGQIAKKWVDANKPGYPVLQDPEFRLIKAFKAQAATYMVLIKPGGQIERAFPGYSRSMIKELGDRIAHLAKVQPRMLKLDDLSKDAVSGCAFVMP